MSTEGNRFYVVTRGRQPGIYLTWDEAEAQVRGYKFSKCKRYSTYEEAVANWNEFASRANLNTAYEPGPSHDGSMHGFGFVVPTNAPKADDLSNAVKQMNISSNPWVPQSSNASDARQANFYGVDDSVAKRRAHEFVLVKSMEKWLATVCRHLNIPTLTYYCEQSVSKSGVPSYRFKVTMARSCVGQNLIAFGRFCQDENEAREDAARAMLDALLSTTGLAIYDFNYERFVGLRERVANLESQVSSLATENAHLKEQLALLQGSRHVCIA